MGDQPIGETTTYTTHMRQTTTGFETNIPAIKWLQIYSLDCTAIGIGTSTVCFENNRGEEHVIPHSCKYLKILSSIVPGPQSGMHATLTGFTVQQKSVYSTTGINSRAYANGTKHL